jgi:hypothetical protein
MRHEPNAALVSELRRRGLSAPARLLLDAHRPLRPLLANAATFLSPLAHPLLGDRLDGLQRALDDDAAYGALLEELESEDS